MRNNDDGSVSLFIEGEATRLDMFRERLEENLGGYIADAVFRETGPEGSGRGFVIRR